MRRFFLAAFAALTLAACSPEAPPESPVRLDEPGLIAAAGKQPVREYGIDDGRGLAFHPERNPPFSIEFRTGRVNVAWWEWTDDEKVHAKNAENRNMARAVLTHALGQESAEKIMTHASIEKPIGFDQQGYRVSLAPGGGMNLLTIRAKQ